MKLFNFTTANKHALGVMLLSGIFFSGCMNDDVYNGGKNVVPPVTEFPDFSTRSAVNLSVDYEAPGRKVLVEIFTVNPFELMPDGSVLRKDILPLYASYTDDNAKLTDNVELPTNIQEVYLCVSAIGLPQCVMAAVTNGAINFKASQLQTRTGAFANTRAVIKPVVVDANKALYTLSDWGQYGNPTQTGFLTPVSGTQTMITYLQKTLWNGNSNKVHGLNNEKLTVDEKYANVTIAKNYMEGGVMQTTVKANISLTFVSEYGWFQNTFGYYYYPAGQKPSDLSMLKKFIIFPNVSTAGTVPYGVSGGKGPYLANKAPLQSSQKVNLVYLDENDNPTEDFPPGYTIGWFVIQDGFSVGNGTSKGLVNTGKTFLYSNESWNKDVTNKRRCISLNYQGKVVLGFEDGDDKSYEDLLFYVESNPIGAILDPDKPTIDDGGGTVVIPDKQDERLGTFIFEDLWPKKGDYDMNDVVVEYSRIVTFDKDNYVKKIVDTFKPVQRPHSASKMNAFAYQVDAAQVGQFIKPENGIEYESATNSFIVSADVAADKGKTFSVTRTFETKFLKKDLKEYNPFIITDYVKGTENRVEVHLPKKKATSKADSNLAMTGDEAYYMDNSGKYPFALDLPILNYIQPVEKNPVNMTDEYPDFTKWVEGGCGITASDWYKKHATIK